MASRYTPAGFVLICFAMTVTVHADRTKSDTKHQAIIRKATAYANTHLKQGRLCAMELQLPDKPWVRKYQLALKAKGVEMLTASPRSDDPVLFAEAYNNTMAKVIDAKIGPSFVAALKDRFEPFTSVVYVIDASGLMFQDYPFVIAELRKRVSRLDRATKFCVIFYQNNKPLVGDEYGLHRATRSRKRAFAQWLDKGGVAPTGGADPGPALKLAHHFKPDKIIWMSNGSTVGHNGATPKKVRYDLNQIRRAHQAPIHTVRVLGGKRIDWMADIARTTGGKHINLTEKDLGIAPPEE